MACRQPKAEPPFVPMGVGKTPEEWCLGTSLLEWTPAAIGVAPYNRPSPSAFSD